MCAVAQQKKIWQGSGADKLGPFWIEQDNDHNHETQAATNQQVVKERIDKRAADECATEWTVGPVAAACNNPSFTPEPSASTEERSEPEQENLVAI